MSYFNTKPKGLASQFTHPTSAHTYWLYIVKERLLLFPAVARGAHYTDTAHPVKPFLKLSVLFRCTALQRRAHYTEPKNRVKSYFAADLPVALFRNEGRIIQRQNQRSMPLQHISHNRVPSHSRTVTYAQEVSHPILTRANLRLPTCSTITDPLVRNRPLSLTFSPFTLTPPC